MKLLNWARSQRRHLLACWWSAGLERPLWRRSELSQLIDFPALGQSEGVEFLRAVKGAPANPSRKPKVEIIKCDPARLWNFCGASRSSTMLTGRHRQQETTSSSPLLFTANTLALANIFVLVGRRQRHRVGWLMESPCGIVICGLNPFGDSIAPPASLRGMCSESS